MSEEEKETIEDCKELVQELKQHKDKDFIGRLYYKSKPVEDILSVLLNLIENQQKELNNLKEIEKSHQQENGKLRVEFEKVYEDNLTLAHELEQEKASNKFDKGLYGLLMKEEEKNKELEEKLKIATAMLTRGTYPEQNEGDNDFDKQFISKDKIKEMKEFYINEHENKNITLIPLENIIKNINVLLEEK